MNLYTGVFRSGDVRGLYQQEIDEDFNIVNIVQKYAIKVGSKFYCSDKKANCTIAGFAPFDYSSDNDLDIIVEYIDGKKGTSHIDLLTPI